jgi:hypothetical protein
MPTIEAGRGKAGCGAVATAELRLTMGNAPAQQTLHWAQSLHAFALPPSAGV